MAKCATGDKHNPQTRRMFLDPYLLEVTRLAKELLTEFKLYLQIV